MGEVMLVMFDLIWMTMLMFAEVATLPVHTRFNVPGSSPGCLLENDASAMFSVVTLIMSPGYLVETVQLSIQCSSLYSLVNKCQESVNKTS